MAAEPETAGSPPPLQDLVSHGLERWRAGDHDGGFFPLLHAGEAALPLLEAACARPENAGLRSAIVNVIWQLRSAAAVPFLGRALRDPEPAVWKEALSGLVTLRDAEAERLLAAAREDVRRGLLGNGLTLEWLDEAIVQAREGA